MQWMLKNARLKYYCIVNIDVSFNSVIGSSKGYSSKIERDYRDDDFWLNFIYMQGIDYTKISAIEINGIKIPVK